MPDSDSGVEDGSCGPQEAGAGRGKHYGSALKVRTGHPYHGLPRGLETTAI